MNNYTVHPITTKDAKPWILQKHYSRTMPVAKRSFGLFNGNVMEGVVIYGAPTTHSLNDGGNILDGVSVDSVYELLRLCVDSKNKNAASFLVGKSLNMLDSPAIVISYADAKVGHVGYIYQATNWIYTGMTKPDKTYTDNRNGNILHGRSVNRMFGSRAAENLPDFIEINEEESGKHRYITFTGNRRQKREMLKALKYPVLDYPKGDTERHESDATFETQMLLF